MWHRSPHIAIFTMSMALTWLAGCGGGGASAPPVTYTVGGTVVGLAGSGLELQLNGGATLAVISAGAFAFPTTLSSGATYSVTVATQPSSLTQTCVVTRGSGTVGTANVADVAVACAPSPFTALVNQPPEAGQLSLLLTDGSVMMQSFNDAGVFYRLTRTAPMSTGSGSGSPARRPATRLLRVRRLCWPTAESYSSAANTTKTNTLCRLRPAA
jgi:hypothetical protein